MGSGDRILLVVDLVLGIISVITGNIGLPALSAIGISAIRYGVVIQTNTVSLIIIPVTLFIAAITYHKVHSKIIKASVIILIFVPFILTLLSFFQVIPLQIRYTPIF